MNVEILGADTTDWDRFVESRDDATFYHSSRWRTLLERHFGHSTSYLIAKDGERVKGVLPLVLLKSGLFGSTLASLPYFCTGGVVAEDEATTRALVDKAKALHRESGAKALVIRHQGPALPGLEVDDSKGSFLVTLDKDPEKVFGRVEKQIRRRIRKASSSGLSVAWGADQLPAFYQVYGTNMRDLGVPIHAFAFYKAVLDAFPENAKVFAVMTAGRPVAAQLLFTFRDRILLACAASLREFLSLSPNNLLYWESIRYGCETGLRYCDLGRSTRNTGPFDFKAQWGGEQRPFTTYFANRDGAAAMASGDSSRYRLFRRVWQRLPLPVVNAIGPRIVKGLP